MITSVTGPLAAERSHDVAVVQALVKNTNAQGGIDGHPVQLIVKDDQSAPATAATAAQLLAGKGVVGVIGDSAVLEGGAANELHSQAIAVSGLADSTSWTADSNMFGVFGYSGPGIPGTTTIGVFEKSIGVDAMGGISYGTVPSSKFVVDQTLKSAAHVGVRTVLNDSGIQLSGENFTTVALQVKSSRAEGLTSGVAANDNVSLATALAQEGYRVKGFVVGAGYEESTLDPASLPSVQGLYFSLDMQPFTAATPAAAAYRSLLKRYAPGTFGGSQEGFAYVAADLLITGLKADGGSSDRSKLIGSLDGLKDFTAGGLLATPVNYSQPKSENPTGLCSYIMTVQGNDFVPHGTKPVCGKPVPSTANVT